MKLVLQQCFWLYSDAIKHTQSVSCKRHIKLQKSNEVANYTFKVLFTFGNDWSKKQKEDKQPKGSHKKSKSLVELLSQLCVCVPGALRAFCIDNLNAKWLQILWSYLLDVLSLSLQVIESIGSRNICSPSNFKLTKLFLR